MRWIARIRKTLADEQLLGPAQLLSTYERLQSEWRASVAAPLLRHPA